MGVFDRLRGKAMEDPVRGTAKVLLAGDGKADGKRGGALITRATLKLSVAAEGLEPTQVEWKGMVKAHKWPRSGVALPVTVDRANPERLEIHWDEAPNVVKQLIGGTPSDLTADQHQLMEESQAKVAEHQAELLELTQKFHNGEIDQDELVRRQTELLG